MSTSAGEKHGEKGKDDVNGIVSNFQEDLRISGPASESGVGSSTSVPTTKVTDTYRPSKSEGEQEEEEEDTSIHAELDTSIPTALYHLANKIQDGKAKKILVLSGAGVSVAAGIPDFRTPGTGLYDNLQKYNLPYPQAVFDIEYYTEDTPLPFCTLARELWPGQIHSPTLTHSFLALLAKKNLLLRNYSQNIDGLEFLAGMPAEQLVECHGHFRTASCTFCHASVDPEEVKQTIVHGSGNKGGGATVIHQRKKGKGRKKTQQNVLIHDHVPLCKSCGGYVKPDIVFFGEALPGRFHQLIETDVRKADLMLILGTSLQVAPVSLIPSMVGDSCPRVLFNREFVLDDATYKYNEDKRGDAFVSGDCDASVTQLCKLLGWHEELLEMHAQSRVSREESKSK